MKLKSEHGTCSKQRAMEAPAIDFKGLISCVSQMVTGSISEERQMKSNMCTAERIVRAVVGVALIGATLSGLIGMWGWFGIVLLATAAVSFCPLYKVLGLDSCGVCRRSTSPPP